jgi:uncharacterized delta-60 repeat protein
MIAAGLIILAQCQGVPKVGEGHNYPPLPPSLGSPAGSADAGTITPVLMVNNGFDPEESSLVYTFEVYSDQGLTQLVASSDPIGETPGTTSWTVTVTLTEDQWYYWRARANDGSKDSPWMPVAGFRVNAVNSAPGAPGYPALADGTEVNGQTVRLEVGPASDPDGKSLFYEFQVDTALDFSSANLLTSGSQPDPFWLTPALLDNTVWYWRARALDNFGAALAPSGFSFAPGDQYQEGPWSGVFSFFVNTANDPPSAPVLNQPPDGGDVTSLTLAVGNATDPDRDTLTYEFQVSSASDFATVLAQRSGLPQEEGGVTSWTISPVLPSGLYYWRCRASDGTAASSWAGPRSFHFILAQNNPPAAPVLSAPATGSFLAGLVPVLVLQNASDPEGDTLTYEFQVSATTGFSTLTASASGLAAGSGTTGWTVSPALLDGTVYYWRARAYDGALNGPWSEVRSFTTDTNGVPSALTSAPTVTAGNGEVNLAWTYAKPVDFKNFVIMRSLTPGIGYTEIAATAATSYRDIGLTNGTTYFYVIAAVDKLGRQSANSPEVASQPKNANTAPGAPTSQTPAAGVYLSTLTPALTVQNAVDPEGDTLTYEFQVSLNMNFSPLVASLAGIAPGVGTTTWTAAPALVDGTLYYWRARVNDGALNGPWSEVRSFTTDTNGVPSATPAPTATAGDKKVDLSWTYTPPSDFDHYRVLRSLASGGPYTWLSDTNANSYQDGGLTNGIPYYYVIQVVDHLGRTSNNSPQGSAKPEKPNTAPGAPVNSAPFLGAYLSTLGPTLEVDNAADPDLDTLTYEFQVSLDINFSDPVTRSAVGVTEGTLTTTWEVRPDLADGTNYYWRARASDGLLNGPWSEVWLFTTDVNEIPATPAAPIASPGNNLVNLSWTYSRPADFGQFQIYRKETSGGSYSWVADTTGNSFKDTGLTNGTTYFYVIAAADQLGRQSGNSPEASAQPGNLDTDGDEMPDNWEIAHGLNPNLDDAALDPDIDGLSNLDEYLRSTDPQDSDSEDDGLNDGDEVNIYLTNPLDSDSDDDNFSDYQEICYNENCDSYIPGDDTDPNDADTDDDGWNDGAEVLCVSDPIDPDSVCIIEDDDGDGFPVNVDCDDDNPYLNPGRGEICENTIDENCSGKCAHDTAICGGPGLILSGDYITIGINQDNSLVDRNWSNGFRFDPDGPGPEIPSRWDWLLLEDQGQESWSLEYENDDDYRFHNNKAVDRDLRNGKTYDEGEYVVMSLEDRSRGNQNLVIGAGKAGDLIVTQIISYPKDVSYVVFTVTIENPGPETAEEVKYLRNVNPDMDDEEETYNDAVSANLITARGRDNGQVLGLGTWEAGAVVSAGGDDVSDPDDIFDWRRDPNGELDDTAINLAFDLGDIPAGGTRTFAYYYIAGTSLALVQRTFSFLRKDWDGDGISNSDEINNYGTDPRKADTDGDGLTDLAEIFAYGTGPTGYDTDGDGISDGEEIRMGRDPLRSSDPSPADTDGDGIPDWKEWVNGTNPNNPDTDGDGLSDGAEANQYCSDPQNVDTDGDGLSDGGEVNTCGSDPADPDTDNDGLSDGGEVNTYGTEPADPDTDDDGFTDWVEVHSGTDPKNPGSHPAPIPRIKINEIHNHYSRWVELYNPETYAVGLTNWVLRWSAGNNGSGEIRIPPILMLPGAYIGLDENCYNDEEGWIYFCTEDIRWCDDSYRPGSVALLNNAGIGVDFVRWDGDIQEPPAGTFWAESGSISFPCWSDSPTLQRKPEGVDTDTDADWYVYEETGGEINDSLDSDDDEIPDWYETNVYHTDPNNWDTDGDLLSDLYEILGSNTDPRDPNDPDPTDTDVDGISDFAEDEYYGTDSGEPDSDYDGLNDYLEIFVYGTEPWNNDCDDDGFSDGQEISAGTDPWSWDTDNDGLGDGEEANNYHTNPGKADTDGDGYGDYLEIKIGSDPNDPGSIPAYLPESESNDTAAACDPVGPISPEARVSGISNYAYDYDYYCIPVTARTLSFDIEAEEFGAWIDSYLILYDRDGNTVLAENDDEADPDTGYYDMDAHLTYSFPVTGTYYLAVYDDDGNYGSAHYWYYLRIRDFTDTDGDGLTDWEETHTYFTDPFDYDSDDDGLSDGSEVKESSSHPNIPDTDGDGLKDGEEVNIYGTDPVISDSDGDGLDDYDEVITCSTNPWSTDTDGDGLGDYLEINTTGTNPNDPDTDGDGFGDGQELNIYHTDPLNPDMDGDGYGDRLEVQMGSYPRAATSTPDLEIETTEPNESRGECQVLGFPYPVTTVSGEVNLAGDVDYYCFSVTGPVRLSFDIEAAEFGSPLNSWIGLSYNPDGEYTLAGNDNACDPETGYCANDSYLAYSITEVGYTYFLRVTGSGGSGGPGQWYYLKIRNLTDSDDDGLTDWEEAYIYGTDPNAADSDGDGLGDGEEIAVGTGPNDPDSDADGMPDGWEDTYGLDPLDPGDAALDPDADGLTNLQEYQNGTDPGSPDTDGDGLEDGGEAGSGADPLLPDTDGDGLGDGAEVYLHNTDPARADSDGDGYSDPIELQMGSDPNAPASKPDLLLEVEPNDTTGTANPIGFPNPVTMVYGEVNPAGDMDYFSFVITGPVTLLFDLEAEELGSPIDPNSSLILTNGVTTLGTNNGRCDPETNYCESDPHITYAFSTPGTYFIGVYVNGGGGGAGQWYYLKIKDVTVTPSVVLTGDYVQVGINQDNSLVDDYTYIGLRYDADGPAPGGWSGDWITPGSALESWTLGFTDALGSSSTLTNDFENDSSDILMSLEDQSFGSTLKAVGSGRADRLVVTQTVEFEQDAKVMTFTINIENTGASPVTNVKYLRNVDPDMDYEAFEEYSTLNDVLLPGDNLVVGAGPYSGYTLGLGSFDPRVVVSAEGFEVFDPDEVLNSPEDPDGVMDDIAINLAANLGTLNPGQSTTLVFYYILGSTVVEVRDLFRGLDQDTDSDGMGDLWETAYEFNPNDPSDAGLDKDSDGLTNLEEYHQGTSADDPDSDGDGLSDGDEVHLYGTSPVNADTDGDGLDDNLELNNYHTDPLNPDMDGDGYSDRIEAQTGSYPRAATSTPVLIFESESNSIVGTCDPLGFPDPVTMTYGEINPDGDRDFFCLAVPGPATWLFDIEAAELGSPLDSYLTLLAPNGSTILAEVDDSQDPDSGFDETDSHFTYSFSGAGTYFLRVNAYDMEGGPGQWYYLRIRDLTDSDEDGLLDWDETNVYGTNPNSSNTDGDAFSDWDEINTWHTDPTNPNDPSLLDADRDGIPDWWEVNIYYTDPNLADTDGDGLPDGYEINVSNTNPLAPDSDQDGYWDRVEVMVFDSDPSRIEDSDNDLLSDWEENYIYRTDPNSWDTDADGYSDGQEVASGTDPLGWKSGPEWSCEEYVNLYDGNGYLFDLDQGYSIRSGTSYAYESGYHLIVNGYYFSSECHVTEAQGREVVYDLRSIYAGGNAYILVTRKIFVPADDGFARFLEILQNPYDYPLVVNAMIRSTLGSEYRTMIVATSSGDQEFAAGDRWLVTDDDYYDGFREPSLAHVFDGPDGRKSADSVGIADGYEPYYQWNNLTVGPHQTVIIMHFAAQNYYRQDSIDQALELEALGGSALENMLTLERASVINWNLPVDSDGDGLSDWEEERLGTNPPLQDTDGDGLSDWMEINIYLTDPNQADMDGDGLSDGEEIHIYSSFPDSPDSDGDGLSDGEERDNLTNPWNDDTDDDSYSDKAEVIVGTNPHDNGSAPAYEFWENFDEGGAFGWSWNGLWYMDGNAANYRRDGSEPSNYNTGTINSGSLVSPEFTVPDAAPVLSFSSYEDTECNGIPGCNYDVRQVYISTNGGLDWDLLWQSGNLAWWGFYEIAVDLADYAGQNVIIRFFFNTVDANNNNYEGWKIDWVSVLKGPLPWAKSYGGSDYDEAWLIQQTTDRGYFMAGYTASFGAGSDDVWIMKLYSDGTVAWQKAYGGTGDEWADYAQQTSDGGYVVASATTSFGSGSSDLWILKLDADGAVAWQKTYGGAEADETYSIQQTSDGGYVAAGYSYSFGSGSYDLWVLKLNADGTVAWQKTYGGTDYEAANSIQQTSDGGYIVAGYTDSFGSGGEDIWVLKLDADGTVAWQKTYGLGDEDWAYAIQQTSDGGYIMAGYTYHSTEPADANFWVLKLDSDGTVDWEKTYGGTEYEYAYAIRQTSDGGYIVAGQTFSFGVDFGDTWILMLDEDGAVTWENAYGGADRDLAYSIQQTAGGGYIAAGYSESFGAGGYETWVLTLSPDGGIALDSGSGAAMMDTTATVTDTSATVTDTSVVGVDSSATVTDTYCSIVDTDASIETQAPAVD